MVILGFEDSYSFYLLTMFWRIGLGGCEIILNIYISCLLQLRIDIKVRLFNLVFYMLYDIFIWHIKRNLKVFHFNMLRDF